MVQKPNKKEEQIFYQALETSPDLRDSFLKEVCGKDKALYHRLPGSYLLIGSVTLQSCG